jgi:hypothetical protein
MLHFGHRSFDHLWRARHPRTLAFFCVRFIFFPSSPYHPVFVVQSQIQHGGGVAARLGAKFYDVIAILWAL